MTNKEQELVQLESLKGLFDFLKKENEKRKIHNKSRSKDTLELTNEAGYNITISHKTYLQLVNAYIQTNKAIPHLENLNQAIIKNASSVNIKTLQSFVKVGNYVKVGNQVKDDAYYVQTDGNLYPDCGSSVIWQIQKFDDILASRFDRDFLTLAVTCNNPANIVPNSSPYSNIYIDDIESVIRTIYHLMVGIRFNDKDKEKIDIRNIIPKTYQRFISSFHRQF